MDRITKLNIQFLLMLHGSAGIGHMVKHHIDDDLHAFTLRLFANTFEFRFLAQLVFTNGPEANRLIKQSPRTCGLII